MTTTALSASLPWDADTATDNLEHARRSRRADLDDGTTSTSGYRRYAQPVEAGLDWRYRGACIGEDPDIWYPERGETTLTAKLICERCEVRGDCLEYALDAGEKHGIWGGTSERERRVLRRRRAVERKAS